MGNDETLAVRRQDCSVSPLAGACGASRTIKVSVTTTGLSPWPISRRQVYRCPGISCNGCIPTTKFASISDPAGSPAGRPTSSTPLNSSGWGTDVPVVVTLCPGTASARPEGNAAHRHPQGHAAPSWHGPWPISGTRLTLVGSERDSNPAITSPARVRCLCPAEDHSRISYRLSACPMVAGLAGRSHNSHLAITAPGRAR
jgi:hypothetical protein